MSEHQDGEPVDAQVVEEGEETQNGHRAEQPPGAQIVRTSAARQALALTPQFGADELVKRLNVIESAMNDAMKDGIDYGNVPGTSKPTLLKPGAEKLSVLFQLDIEPVTHKHWEGDHLTAVCEAIAWHAPTGVRLGKGEGVCTTREKKYAKRRKDRTCPDCGEAAILRSKHKGHAGDEDAPPEWFCWKKKGGCGHTFPHDDARIVNQEEGEVDNPDLPDTWNTIVKMAEKRARVDVVLAVTGASALFTQDVEDATGPPVDDEVDSGKVPKYGVKTDQVDRVSKALAYMLDVGDGPNEDAATQVLSTLTAKFGDAYEGALPAAAGHAIFEAALLLSQIRTGPDQVPDEPTGDPAGEGGEKPADIDF